MRIVRLLFIILALPIFSGCASTAILVGAGSLSTAGSAIWWFYTAWKEGEGVTYYPYSTAVVHRAAILALKDMEMKISSDTGDTFNAQLPGTTHFRLLNTVRATKSSQIIAGNRNRFKITVEAIEKNATRLKLRIDFMGDRPYGDMFFQKVHEYLNVITLDMKGKPKLNE